LGTAAWTKSSARADAVGVGADSSTYRVITEDEVVCSNRGTPVSFASSKSFANEYGGRLATAQELRSMLAIKYANGAVAPGQNQWVAVLNTDGMEDYI
jgi:hypothetical protein